MSATTPVDGGGEVRGRRRARHAAGLLLVAAVLAATGCGAPGSPGTPSSLGPPPPGPPGALAVKIDNVAEARPATGLSGAAAIYVELVEGGLTRLIAVYGDRRPDVVGPVRSARATDIEVLAQYGRPVFAYSGAAPELLPALHAAPLVDAAQAQSPAAYVRQGPRVAPHNLYVRPAALPAGAGPFPGALFAANPAPGGGVPTTDRRVAFPAATYDFRWSAAAGRWLVTLDGTPFVSTEAGQLGAATVVVQRVVVTASDYPEDPTGARAPAAHTVGSGPVEVLRDGASFTGTWSRPTAGDPTVFRTSGGDPIPVAAGPIWVLLLPQ